MSWKIWVMILVIFHIVAGFAWFIWKLEIQGRKKDKDSSENIDE
jgi:hypothetical protein